MPKVVQEFNIQIGGEVLSSLAQAVGMTEQQLRSIMDVAKLVNKNAGVANKGMFAGATQEASTFMSKLGEVKTVMEGVFLGNMATQFFNTAVSGAEQLIGAMKDASKVAADMETQSFELATDMGLSPTQMKDFKTYLYQKSKEVPVTVTTAMEAARLMSTSSAESDPTKKTEYVKNQLKIMEDMSAVLTPAGGGVAGLNSTLLELSQAVSQTQKAGALREKGMHMLEGKGVMMRPWLEENLKMLPEGVTAGNMAEKLSPEQIDQINLELYKRIASHKDPIPSSKLDEFLAAQDAPGGKYYDKRLEAGKTTSGIESSSQDMIGFMQAQVGDVINGPLKTLLDRINSGFAEQIPKMSEYFDKLGASVNKVMNPVIDKFITDLEKQDWSKVSADFDKVIASMGPLMTHLQPFLDWLAKDVPNEIDTILRIGHAIEQVAGAIERAFNWALGAGAKIAAASSYTPTDVANNAQDRLNALVSAGASDESIAAAKKAVQDALQNLPHKAAGGIVTQATALVAGEAGPEAIIPLTMLENSPLITATLDNVRAQMTTSDNMVKLTDTMTNLSAVIASMPQGGFGAGFTGGGGSGGGGQGYSATNWGNVSAYDDAFREASEKSGIPFNTLKGIALQEGVDPRDNNPMGISSGANGLNADHFSKEDAKAHIIRQAMLPYMRGFRDDATPEQRRKAYSIYTPVGADNDRGQNKYKQSETDAIINKLNKGDQASATFNIHIHAIDSASFASTVHEHAEVIADHVHHVLELRHERNSFV